MKKLLYISLLMIFLLSACAGNAASTATVVPSTQTPAAQVFVTQVPSLQLPPTQAPATAQPVVTNPPGCTDSASFVADVTVPDHTNFNHGDVIHKVWRVKNSGTCAWNSQYTLVFASGNQMDAPDSTQLSATQPGDTLDIAVDMVAPAEDGAYRGDFEIQNPSGVALPIDHAKTLWAAITVGAATAGSSGTSTSAPSSGSIPNTGGSGTTLATGPGLVTSTCAFTVNQSNVNDVVTAVNAYRAKNGLPPYNVNAQLMQAAQSHSEDMACNNLFVHTGSNGSTPSSRVAAAGYSASNVTENVYGSFPPLTGQGAVTWWATDQTDPNHNLNLISTKFKDIGVGYAFFNNYGYYVIDFAAP
jgi:uncharacterized protein YkwD